MNELTVTREQLAIQLLEGLREGASLRELGQKYDVSKDTVARLLLREVPGQYRGAQEAGLIERLVAAENGRRDQVRRRCAELGIRIESRGDAFRLIGRGVDLIVTDLAMVVPDDRKSGWSRQASSI